MELIEWRKEFCTGIEGIDYEHEQLINQINSVYALLDDKADRQKVLDSLGDIYGNISAHFALEEQLMRKHGYDYYQQHRADHERLLDDIVEITDNFEKSSELDEPQFKQTMRDWFQQHFKTHDSRLHKLAELMSQHAVAEPVMKSLFRAARNKFLRRAG